jgi:subtilisin-like proprotein convertase family protein
MDARRLIKWFVVILIMMLSAYDRPVLAGSVYNYPGDFNLPIPAPDQPESEFGRGWMADATLNVADHVTIYDLDVRLSLTHGSLFDLEILLESPAGTSVALNLAGNTAFIIRGEDGRLTAVGGTFDLLFDDEAATPIDQAAKPFTGPFQPTASLSSFDQQDAFGTWYLRIYDAFYADTGTLDGFELVITTPEPATAILLIFGTALATLLRPHQKNREKCCCRTKNKDAS